MFGYTPDLTAFTATKTDSLPILLELGNQRIAVLDHIGVLLVLIIGPIGLDDAIDSVDGACNPVTRDELGEVPTKSVDNSRTR